MSDVMLHGVLNIPPELWDESEIDKMQRYQRYMQASRRIEDDERKITRLRGQLQNCVNHLERARRQHYEGDRKYADAIEAANKCLYETLID